MRGLCRLPLRIVLFVTLAAPAAALAQETPLTGARITIVEKPEAAIAVTLENLRDRALVAWNIGIVAAGQSEPRGTWKSDYTAVRQYADDTGPIAPAARRIINMDTTLAGEGATAVVTFALFADGYYEGQPDAPEAFRARREQESFDLRYWIDALAAVPPGTDADVRRVLDRRLKEDRARHADGQPSNFAARLWRLTQPRVSPAAGSLHTELERYRTEAEAHLALLQQPMAAGGPGGLVTSVGVTSRPLAVGRLYARVENLRDVPLEAVGLARYRSGTNVLESGWTLDFCTSLDAAPGDGRIRPGETRDLRLTWTRQADGTLPAVVPQLVMFEDLKWEGSAAARASLLAQRSRSAAEAAYWISALTDAAALPAAQARELLEQKKRDRTTRSGDFGYTHEVDQVIARASTSPEDFTAYTLTVTGRLQHQHAMLSRHHAR